MLHTELKSKQNKSTNQMIFTILYHDFILLFIIIIIYYIMIFILLFILLVAHWLNKISPVIKNCGYKKLVGNWQLRSSLYRTFFIESSTTRIKMLFLKRRRKGKEVRRNCIPSCYCIVEAISASSRIFHK